MHKNNDTIMPSQLIAQNDHAYVLTFLMSIAMAILLLVALFYRIKKQAAAMAAKRKQQPKLPPGLATMPVVRNMHQMLMNKPVFRWIHRLLAGDGPGGPAQEGRHARLPAIVVRVADVQLWVQEHHHVAGR